MRKQIFLGLGGNLGNRENFLKSAVQLIEERVGSVEQVAPIYETKAWGVADQQDYLNTVVEIQSNLSNQEILRLVQEIENTLGRERKERWGSRTIDIDLLFDGDFKSSDPDLTLPHPRLASRNFVLHPLRDIAPQFVHPLLKKTIADLCEESEDTTLVKRYEHPMHPYLVVEGNIGAGKTTLSKMLAEQFGTKLILEEFSDNPFLPYFYENPERYAFTVELFFTTERHKQLQEHLGQQDLFRRGTVADYTFVKTLLFAKINLRDNEWQLFQRLFHIMNASFPRPDLLVYLHRSAEDLRRNIVQRGRSYEQSIALEYLEEVQRSYFEYFRSVETELPILVIDVENVHFWNDEAAYQQLESLINRPYPIGMHYRSLAPTAAIPESK